MKAVVQRVKEAEVKVDGKVAGKIKAGILLLIGIGKNDTAEDLKWMEDKIPNLRIFEDENQKMNRSLLDINGDLLVISQFTLFGDASHGRRPSFSDAAPAETARQMYEKFCDDISKSYPSIKVERGIFQTYMQVNLLNDGPVTIIVDSKERR
ncbi:D-aminoacyl-tRNA deacylase [Athalassotoga sp.]|uniref:D-aminoacyl-tRNA deacylase n=1 Tax=Athalassotoga sp. TaxID=2022597 RepID=UPI003D053428